jgi:hypothetical protein
MMSFLFLLSARADTPDPPESCYDSVLIDMTGTSDEPTCWFVDGNASYTSPEVTAGDLQVLELPTGRVIARCTAWLDNDHGHAVHWDTSNSCETDPTVLCEIGLDDGSNVSTSDWRITVSASGRATLHCFYDP